MPKLRKAQVMILDGILSILMAMTISYVLFAAWPQHRQTTSQLALERAGYDIVNAFYEDREIYQTIRKGFEAKGYLSASEVEYLRTRLYNYGRMLGVSRVDVDIEGSEQFSVEVTPSTPARREQFTLIMPLRGGADDRIIRVSLWE